MKNRKIKLLPGAVALLVLLPFSSLSAQRIQLSPFLGYETGAKINTSLGSLHIEDGMDFGAILNVGIGGGRYAELSYSHLGTELSTDHEATYTPVCDLAVDYYSLGMLQELKPAEKTTPYGLLTLGVVNYRPTSGDISGENKVHISLAGGVKTKLSEKIGLRFQARLLLPLYYAGTYFTFGTGGTGYGISGGIHGVQGDFTGAVVVTLK